MDLPLGIEVTDRFEQSCVRLEFSSQRSDNIHDLQSDKLEW